MPKLNANIYGDDPTSAAESIASDALDTSGTGWGNTDLSDYWGPTREPRGFGKGNTPEYEDYDVDIIRNTNAGGGDTEDMVSEYPQTKMMPRHVPGPKTAIDSDNRKPPARQVSTKISRYPDYSKG